MRSKSNSARLKWEIEAPYAPQAIAQALWRRTRIIYARIADELGLWATSWEMQTSRIQDQAWAEKFLTRFADFLFSFSLSLSL